MDYGNEIILACTSGIKELEAIMDYTQKIQSTQNDAMRQVYTDNRADELPHIQNLVVAITAMLSGEEPTAAAQMDGKLDEATPTPPDGGSEGAGGDDK